MLSIARARGGNLCSRSAWGAMIFRVWRRKNVSEPSNGPLRPNRQLAFGKCGAAHRSAGKINRGGETWDLSPKLEQASALGTLSSLAPVNPVLCPCDVDVNRVDATGFTPLDLAREESHDELVTALMAAGAVSGEALPADEIARAKVTMDDIRPADHDYLTEWIMQAEPATQIGVLFVFAPLFMHLWFLYYLLWMVGGFVLVAVH